MPDNKRTLLIDIRISKADKRAANAVVKQLGSIRKAAREVANALNAIGAARFDTRRLSSISKALGELTVIKKIKPQDAAGIRSVAKALQLFKAFGKKDTTAIKDITAQVNQLTAAASKANIKNLSTQLGALNKAFQAMNRSSKSIGNVKTLLENISKIRLKTTANGIKAMSNAVVNLSRRFIKNREKIDEAIKILRGFKNAANQAFRVEKLSAFEQKLRNIVALLDSALKKTARVSGTVLGSTGAVTTAATGAATGGPTAPPPQQQRTPTTGTATETQLKKDAAALAKVTAQLDALQQKAARFKQQAKQFEAVGKGSTSLADKLAALGPRYDELKNKGIALSQTLRANADAAARLGIQAGAVTGQFVGVAKGAKSAVAGTAQMATSMNRLAVTMKRPLTFTQMLSEGFNKIAASQIKFFAASLLLYRGLQLISEQFGKVLEISDRTAKAFAVSRSNVVLLEERFDLLGSTIEETTARTGRSIQEVSEILFQFGSAGLQAEESFAALDSTLNLIIATDADVTLTTKTVAATYRLLGDTLDDVGGKAEKFARINDVIAAAYRDNQVEINELTQAYKFAIPVAKQLRLSFEETTGIIATLQNNMIRAGEAGRSLRAIFSRVSSQSKEFAAAFGIAIDPTQPLDFLDILEQVNARMQEGSLTADQVGTVFQRLGLRGANSFLILTQNMDDVRKTIKTLETDSQGAARAMAEIRLETPAGQVKIFGENVSRLIRTGLMPLLAILFQVVRGINLFAKAISGTIVEKLIAGLSALIVILGVIKLITVAYALVIGAMAAAKLKAAEAAAIETAALEIEAKALLDSAAATGANITATEALAQAKIKLATATTGAAGSTGKFSAGILALGAKLVIILAILAAVAAAIALITNATEISVWWNNRQLRSLNGEIRERKKQQDSIDESIERVKELERAQRRGLATTRDVSNAIAEAGQKHESLAVAAALAADNAKEFIRLAELEKEAVDQAIKDVNIERSERFSENIKDLTDKMKVLAREGLGAKKIIELQTAAIQNNANLTEEQKNELIKNNKTLKFYKNTLADVTEGMRENKAAFGALVSENKDLVAGEIDSIQVFNNLGRVLAVTDDKAKQATDAFINLRRQARNVQDIDFSKQLDQLVSIGGAAQTGLEGFAQMVLFEFEIVVPRERLDRTIAEINDKIRQVNEIELAVKDEQNALDLYEELARTVQGVEIEIDLEGVREQASAVGHTFANAISDSIETTGIDVAVLFENIEGEQLFDVVGLSESVAVQTELLSVSEDVLKTDKRYEDTQKSIADVQKEILRQVNDRADILRAEAKGDLIKIQGIEEDRQRAVNTVNELFKNRIRLYNLLLQAQLKSGVLAEQFAYITQQTDSLIAQRGQINEDDLDVQRERVTLLEKQRDEQQRVYEQTVAALEAATKLANSSTDITVEVKQQAEASAKLAETLEAVAAARLEEFNILERVRSLYAKARNDINQQRLGVEATSGSLRGQLVELRKIYGIQANTRNLIDEANTAEKERIQNATQTSREIEFANGAAGNSTEIAAKYLAFKVKEFEIQQKITEEVRKTNEALRNSVQDLDVLRTGSSKVLDLRFKISNLLEDEDRLNQKINKHESVRKVLNIAREKRTRVIVDLEEKIEKLRDIAATKGTRNRKQLISLENQLLRLRDGEFKNLEAIKTKSDDIKKVQSEANKIILTRLQAQRDLVTTEFDYRDAVYQTLQGFDDVRLSVLETLDLEDSRLARQTRLNRLAIESARVENRRKQLEDEIVTLSGKALKDSELSQDQQRRAFELARDQADVLAKILEAHKQIAEELQNQEIELAEQLTSIYQKQLDILSQISDKINENLNTELQFTFNQQPFTEMIGAAQLLGESLFEIERIGTEEVLRRLSEGFADGSISADNFTGQMHDAVAALRALNEQQQRLIEAQNRLQEARYELGLQKFSSAFAAGDFEKALDALGEMENAAEVIDSITGEVDMGQTLGRLQTAAFAGEELAKAMKNAKEENKDSFEVYARGQELLDTINTVTKDIFDNIGGTTFSAKFLQQLNEVSQKFRTMSGLLRQISNLEPGGAGPAPLEFQHGGGVPGVGTGDIVPAMLEPGEYVIPKHIVEKLGVGFFERIRRFKTGGPVGMQDGGLAEGNPIIFSISEVDEALHGITFTASEVEEALHGITFTAEEVKEALSEITFTLEEVYATPPEAVVFSDEDARRNEILLRIEELGVKNAESYEQLSENFLSKLLPFIEKSAAERNEKLDILAKAGLPPESFGPGRLEETLDLPLEEVREFADAFAVPDVAIVEEGVENLAVSFVYEEQLEMLKQQLAALSPTEVSLHFTETGLSGILSRLPTVQTGERLAGLQGGGPVGGSGIGDVIPALLEPGEFVVRKDVVDKIGLRFFEGVNRYQSGGFVGRYQDGGPGVSQEKLVQLLSALENAFTGEPKLQEIKAEDIEFEKVPTLQAIKAEDIVFEEIPKVNVVLGEIEIIEPVTIGKIEFIETPEPTATVAALQTGGPVPGAGVGDIVPAMLEPGEYVIPRGVVSALGTRFFDALRNQNVLTNMRRVIRGAQNTFNAVFGGGQNIPAFQAAVTGHQGLVPGVQTGDVVAANLDEGDYVIPKRTVKLFGADFFSRLRDPELVRELVQSNRERILDNISHNDFVNRREDVITESGRRVQALRGGGSVGFAHYQRGTGRGGAALVGSDPSSIEPNIELIKSGIFGMRDTMARGMASMISKLSDIAKNIGGSVVDLLHTIADPDFSSDVETGEINFSLGDIEIRGAAKVAQLASDAAEASDSLEKAGENASKMGEAISEAAPAAAKVADSTKDVKDSTKVASEQTILGADEEQNLAILNNETKKNTEEATSLAAAWEKVSSGLKGQGKSAVDVISGVWGKFQAQIQSSNKVVKDLIKTIIGPFKNAVSAALKSVGEEFSTLFKDAIPGFIGSFVDNVLVANAEVEADYRRSMNDIKDTFNDQRADLVEQLKRNEISYFDYFNKLEDLQHDSADQRNDIEADRLNALQENINGTFRELAQGFADLVVDLTDQFSSFFNKVIDGATSFLESLEPVFETVAAGVGVAIETVIGVAGGAGLGGALLGSLGGVLGSVVPGAGTAAGAGIGLAIGAGVGGAIGEIFSSVVPIVGDIAKVFNDILSSMVQGAAQLIPILIDLATLPQEEFASLFGGTFIETTVDPITGEIIEEAITVPFEESLVGELPQVIADMGAQLIDRLGVIAERLPDIIPDIAGAFLELVAPSEAGAKSVITAVADTMIAVMPTIATELIKVLNTLSTSLPGIFQGIFDSLVETMKTVFQDPNRIKDAIIGFIRSIVSIIVSAAETIPDAIIGISDEVKQIAPDIITTLANAISDSAIALTDAAIVIIKVFADVMTDPAVVQALASAMITLLKAAFDIILTALKELVPGFELWLGYVQAVGVAILTIATIINAIWLPAIAAIAFVFAPILVPMAAAAALAIALGFAFTALQDAFAGIVLALIFTIGKLLIIEPVLTLFNSIRKTFEAFMAALKADPRFIAAMDKMNMAFAEMQEAIQELTGVSGEGVVIDWLLEALLALIPLLVAFAQIITGVAEAVNFILGLFLKLQDAIRGVSDAIWGRSLGPDLIALVDVINMFTTPIATVIDLFTTLANLIQSTLVAAFDSIVTAIQTIIDMVPDLPEPGDIPQAAGEAAGGLVETGKDIYNATLGQVFGTLHSGGIFPTDMDTTNVRALAADEGIAVLRAGEGVLTHAGVEAIGGPSAVDAANGGADIFTTIPPKALQGGEETTFGEANAGFGVEPASNEQGGGGEETTINLDITFDNCQFNGEDVADVVEANLAEKLQNRDGVVYSEIKKQKGDQNPGIRRR